MSDFFAKAKRDSERSLSPFERLAGRLRGRLRSLGGEFRHLAKDLKGISGKHLKGVSGDLRGLVSGLRSASREARTGAGDFFGFNGAMSRINRTFSFFGNILRTLKLPAFAAAIGLTAQALSALAEAAVATTAALSPLAGLLVYYPLVPSLPLRPSAC